MDEKIKRCVCGREATLTSSGFPDGWVWVQCMGQGVDDPTCWRGPLVRMPEVTEGEARKDAFGRAVKGAIAAWNEVMGVAREKREAGDEVQG